MAEPGNLYVISAPSGTGKTTLVKALVEAISGLNVSISYTTRKKRATEVHGVNYYFIEQAEFDKLVEHNDFLEHATVFGNSYGTSRRWVEETLKHGDDVILEIDWQGGQQIHQLFPNSISIFILPPSVNDLYDRLMKRNQDNPEIIRQRLADVRESTRHINEYGYIVINDDFSEALHDLKNIVHAGRLSLKRQIVKFSHLLTELVNAKVDQL
ncbi:MAG: guanylate kinase [Pseudomonadota bacterium]